MRPALKTALILIAITLVTGWIGAWFVFGRDALAASDPPQVGETSYVSLYRAGAGQSWSFAWRKNGATATTPTYSVTDNGSGRYTLAVTWASAGDWEIDATAAGQTDYLSQSVVSAGAGGGTSTTVVVAPYPGGAGYAQPLTTGSNIHVFKGNAVTVPVAILDANGPLNLTGATLTFAGKVNLTDTTYCIGTGSPKAPRNITSDIVNAAAGTVNVKLTTADTSITATKCIIEIKMTKDGSPITVWRANLYIDPVVIP